MYRSVNFFRLLILRILLRMPSVLRDVIVKHLINTPSCFGDYMDYDELEYGSTSYWSDRKLETLKEVFRHQATNDFEILHRNLGVYTALSLAADVGDSGGGVKRSRFGRW